MVFCRKKNDDIKYGRLLGNCEEKTVAEEWIDLSSLRKFAPRNSVNSAVWTEMHLNYCKPRHNFSHYKPLLYSLFCSLRR